MIKNQVYLIKIIFLRGITFSNNLQQYKMGVVCYINMCARPTGRQSRPARDC